MAKFSFYILMVGVLSLSACGDSEKGDKLSFQDTFRITDNVSNSVFSQGEEIVEGEFRLQVISTEVSSAYVDLNDQRILSPNDFKNVSFDRTYEVDLFEENSIEVELRGSPGDQLCVRVYEEITDEDTEEVTERNIYERCVDRKAGPPNKVSVVITPTPVP